MGTRARPQTQAHGYRRIPRPTDFSPGAKTALPHALHLAGRGGAELIVLHILSPAAIYAPPTMSGAVWARLDAEMREAAEVQLRWAVADAQASRPRGLRVRSLLAWGSAFDQIPRMAKRLRCDLIVLASHGRTGLRHVPLGSVAENVVLRAHCPVLTMRPARRKQ